MHGGCRRQPSTETRAVNFGCWEFMIVVMSGGGVALWETCKYNSQYGNDVINILFAPYLGDVEESD